jgi:hypothetical protein
MKNYMYVLLVAPILTLLCYACAEKPPIDNNPSSNKFIGTWVQYYPCDSLNVSCKTWVFTNENTIKFIDNNTEFPVTYLDNNQLQINFGPSATYEYSISDSDLVIYDYFDQMGLTFDFKFTKQ